MSTDEEEGPKGFSGLDRLLPAEADVPAPTESPGTEVIGAAETDRGSGDQTEPPPPAANKTSAYWGLGVAWLIGAFVVFFVAAMLANDLGDIDPPRGAENSEAPHMGQPTETVVIRTDPTLPAPTVALDGEEMPKGGEQGVLTAAQTRWCLYERRRLDAMEEFASGELEIASLKRFVGRYKRRCADARHRDEHLAAIEREITAEGRRLQGEGVERILEVRGPASAAQGERSP